MAKLDLKYYIFDWDDNLLFMPTLIHLQLDGEPIDVTTKEYAKLRHDKAYRLLNDNPDEAFEGFRDETGDFVGDTRKAIGAGRFAPSFSAFKNAVIKARLFSIVTARGHSSGTIRKGVELLIEKCLTPTEKEAMLSNIQKFNRLAGLEIPAAEQLARYLDLNGYVGVSSPGFLKVFNEHALQGLDTGASNPENSKTFAVRRFVERTLELTNNISADIRQIAFGFSDDDPRNLATVRQFLDDKLTSEFPNVDFFVYDTSQGTVEVEQL